MFVTRRFGLNCHERIEWFLLALRGLMMPHDFRKQWLVLLQELGRVVFLRKLRRGQIGWWFSLYDLLGFLWGYYQSNMPRRYRLWGILGCVAISLHINRSEMLLYRAFSISLRQWNQWVTICRELEGTKVFVDCWLWQVVRIKFKCVQFWNRLLLICMVQLHG